MSVLDPQLLTSSTRNNDAPINTNVALATSKQPCYLAQSSLPLSNFRPVLGTAVSLSSFQLLAQHYPLTRSSAVAERPRDVFVCSQLQHTYTAQFFITSYCGFRFTSAQNSNKFCSAVYYCPRRCPTKLPGRIPLGHNPLVFCRLWVGWGQDPASRIG